MKSFFSTIIFCLIGLVTAQAQTPSLKISIYEDSLKKLGVTISNDTIESNRQEANYKFVRTLLSALKEQNSYEYPFNEIQDLISIKKSEDNKFRIFTWFVMSESGEFRYYGAIQLNNPSKLELIPLIDNTENIENPENASLLSTEWLGAVYYSILPVTQGKNNYYMLLGWKGKNFRTSSKVIEILSLENGKANFGLPVLESESKSNKFLNRKIFSYVSEVSMLLRYIKDEKLLVFDHLTAPNDQLKGMTDFYGPDLSYDAYKYKNGKWFFQDDVKLKNAPDVTDDLLVDPSTVNPGTMPIRQY